MYNKVFSYDFNQNEQVFSGFSKILNEIRDAKQWTQEEMNFEFERRKSLLDGLVKNNITDYTNITRIINIYYKDPETAMKMASSEVAAPYFINSTGVNGDSLNSLKVKAEPLVEISLPNVNWIL